MNNSATYGYDEFNRLSATNIGSGQQTFSYVYDRYGNRVQQNAPQGGPQPQYSVNTANNQITSFAYDAAGNLLNNGINSYAYDAEGNLLSVGGTAQYVYDALNRRVSAQTTLTISEYVFDAAGRRVSTWAAANNTGTEGRIYWGGQQIAYRAADGTTYFDHKDWLGTERLRTTYTGAVASSYTSLPWGDGYSANETNPNGNAQDNSHFALLDRDNESSTDHAQFRQFSNIQGRWMSPDPSNGSYDSRNPQSLNRYIYALNNPLRLRDPSGLDEEDAQDGDSNPCDQLTCFVTPGEGIGFGGGGGGGDDGETGPIATFDWSGPAVASFGTQIESVTVTADPISPLDILSLVNWITSGIGYFSDTPVTCQLVAPGGNYNLGPNAVALFQQPMANALTNAFNFLNSQGITPTINSGYRSPADQVRMQNGGSGTNPAPSVSWHEAGMAVDINGTSSSSFPTIVSAMQGQGLTWGGTFTHRDLPHFQLSHKGTKPSAALVSACAGGHA